VNNSNYGCTKTTVVRRKLYIILALC